MVDDVVIADFLVKGCRQNELVVRFSLVNRSIELNILADRSCRERCEILKIDGLLIVVPQNCK